MTIVEVTILNGNPSESEVFVDGVKKEHVLTTQELEDVAGSITELQTIDATNCGWYIATDKSANRIQFFLKDPSIDANNAVCDKGGNVSEDGTPDAYAKLNAAVSSILSAVIP